MPQSGKQFVGFGFGPIQSALFVYEAQRSGSFRGFTIAEVDRALVRDVGAHGGRYSINIAHPDRIEAVTVEGVRLLDPADALQRAELVEAASAADEMCTALPSVELYTAGGTASVASVLAEAIQRRSAECPAIIYAAENHNRAAEILREELGRHVPADRLSSIQVLNTVIGKMSGVITDPTEVARLRLAPLTPSTPRAVLVEAFNRILITRITLPGVRSGIPAFIEKDNLLPFEEAKLFGHNAIHALLGYLAHRRGLRAMDQLEQHPDLLDIGRQAFLDESGAALCRKHAALGDALFTLAGFQEYAEDLLRRMVNPNLNDLVARVIRDPRRKLGYDDRFFGTMRLALEQGMAPTHMALGAAAAAQVLAQETHLTLTDAQALDHLLHSVWRTTQDRWAPKLIDLTWRALQDLGR